MSNEQSWEDNVLDTLESIETLLKQLVHQNAVTRPPEVADDRDLDGQYGNFEVKFTPRDWTGHNFKGARLSECSPEFLEMLADTFDYFARKAEESNEVSNSGKPVAPFKRRDAARCRGWAKRNRERGVREPAPQAVAEDGFAESGSDWT